MNLEARQCSRQVEQKQTALASFSRSPSGDQEDSQPRTISQKQKGKQQGLRAVDIGRENGSQTEIPGSRRPRAVRRAGRPGWRTAIANWQNTVSLHVFYTFYGKSRSFAAARVCTQKKSKRTISPETRFMGFQFVSIIRESHLMFTFSHTKLDSVDILDAKSYDRWPRHVVYRRLVQDACISGTLRTGLDRRLTVILRLDPDNRHRGLVIGAVDAQGVTACSTGRYGGLFTWGRCFLGVLLLFWEINKSRTVRGRGCETAKRDLTKHTCPFLGYHRRPSSGDDRAEDIKHICHAGD
ncbi:hypothetical protein EVAR_53848_1 [Eumeta japonica]|uniref:Uncharacterized protein n=1 Tax=Eumeta variegata TaxID=151549 RepID=A0A4C1XG42_EUMVA|nr:hypothetical protein EVAR_53848_1 [Eumeta japonica]